MNTTLTSNHSDRLDRFPTKLAGVAPSGILCIDLEAGFVGIHMPLEASERHDREVVFGGAPLLEACVASVSEVGKSDVWRGPGHVAPFCR